MSDVVNEFPVLAMPNQSQHSSMGKKEKKSKVIGLAQFASAKNRNTTPQTNLSLQDRLQKKMSGYGSTLSLESENICDSGVALLVGKSEKLQRFDSINLKSNSISSTGATSISEIIKKNKKLTCLNLEYNSITSQGISRIVNAILENPYERKLKPVEVAADLKNNIVNSALTELNISSNGIGEEGAQSLALLLDGSKLKKTKKNEKQKKKMNSKGKNGKTNLKYLDAAYCSMGFNGATILAKALEKNKCLLRLNISWNGIGFTGAEAIAIALGNNPRSCLTNLNLKGNSIGDRGVQAIAKSIIDQHNSSLACINLEWNNVGNDGAISLAELICTNRTLQRIQLARNCICDAGVQALRDAMSNNETITTLSLHENMMNEESHADILKVTDANREKRKGKSLKRLKRRAFVVSLLQNSIRSMTIGKEKKEHEKHVETTSRYEKIKYVAMGYKETGRIVSNTIKEENVVNRTKLLPCIVKSKKTKKKYSQPMANHKKEEKVQRCYNFTPHRLDQSNQDSLKNDNILDNLRKLHELKVVEAITQEEFILLKEKILKV